MGVYAHELTHLLGIGDNYNNPYGEPLRRAYTGIWSMMSRGSFNGRAVRTPLADPTDQRRLDGLAAHRAGQAQDRSAR
ncbi:immune inhibitor A domain-containing protein [Micromonospora sp. M12]